MKLHRYAVVELRPAPAALQRRLLLETPRGVLVRINSFEGSADVTGATTQASGLTVTWGRKAETDPARVMIEAMMPVEFTVTGHSIAVQRESVTLAETALSQAANLLAVMCQAEFDVFSPRPYLFLESQTPEEAGTLAESIRIRLPALKGGAPRLAPGGHQDTDFHRMLSDRPAGVALLGAALAAGHGVSKLHELMRVFENAFAVAGRRLVDPLAEFLRSHPWSLGYTRGEVRLWVTHLRDPATHADLLKAKRVLLDPDVEGSLPRIEQAAYDVLFNKGRWHNVDPARINRWAFSGMVLSDGSVVGADDAVLRVFNDWDHSQAFRLNSRYRIRTDSLPIGWKGADWFFSEKQWTILRQEEAPSARIHR